MATVEDGCIGIGVLFVFFVVHRYCLYRKEVFPVVISGRVSVLSRGL